MVIDEEFGGFYSDLSLDFEVAGEQRKPLFIQARHVWSASQAATFIPGDPRYSRVAEHGFRFLRDVMWDGAHGGFLPRVYARARDGAWPAGADAGGRTRRGRGARLVQDLVRNRATRAVASRVGLRRRRRGQPMVKDVYGDAFAIFGLAAYSRFSEEQEALDLARASFRWLERYSHDPVHGGYRRYVARDGTPLDAGPRGEPPKDLDSTLHLLEADRRNRNFALDHVSFGHDIETAALLIEASEALGLEDDTATYTVARRLVDHCLDHGWDAERGGLYEAGYYASEDGSCEIIIDTKIYWAQAETLNTLSLMADLYRDDPRDYLGRFVAQWRYCDRYILDHRRGGWYWCGLDTLAEVDQPGKGSPVHGTYHTGRALMNSIRRFGEPRTLDDDVGPERP